MFTFHLPKDFKVAFFLTIKSIIKGNRGTLFMVIVMMALVFNNLIFLTSIMNGLSATAHAQIIHFLTGHIVVEPKSDTDAIDHAEKLQKMINQIYGIEACTIRNDISGEIEFNNRKSRFQISALDPKTEPLVTDIQDKIVEGRYLDATDTDSVLMGVQIAGRENTELKTYSLNGVHVGDKISIAFYNGIKKEYTVKGIFDTNFVQSDIRTYITKKEMDAIFPERRDQASQILIKSSNEKNLQPIVQSMRDAGIKENIRTWEDTAGVIKSVTESFDGINILVSAIALFVAGITIFIVIYVDILHRRKDIGILRAIGITEMAIGISYLFRSLFYTICGILLGFFVFTFFVVPYFQNNPMHLPLGDVSLVIENQYLYLRGLSLLIAAFLGAYVPVKRALRIKIIDAIWGE